MKMFAATWLLLACAEPETVQGKILYGTFSMSARLDTDGCAIRGEAAFTNTVTMSADPPDRFYMRVAGQSDRTGTISGALFQIDGGLVAQTIEECPCLGTRIQERIEARFAYEVPDGGALDGGIPEGQPAPADPDGGILPESFSGTLTDTVVADPGCVCVDAGPLPCQVVYSLTGNRQ